MVPNLLLTIQSQSEDNIQRLFAYRPRPPCRNIGSASTMWSKVFVISGDREILVTDGHLHGMIVAAVVWRPDLHESLRATE